MAALTIIYKSSFSACEDCSYTRDSGPGRKYKATKNGFHVSWMFRIGMIYNKLITEVSQLHMYIYVQKCANDIIFTCCNQDLSKLGESLKIEVLDCMFAENLKIAECLR